MTGLASERAISRAQTLGFALVAMTVLAVQITVSRLFAGTMTYYYAFMLVSLAMLGLASGGLVTQLLPEFFLPERFAQQSAVFSIAMGMSGFAGTLAMLQVYPHMKSGGSLAVVSGNFWVLTGVFWCFFPLFLFAGLVVALVFSHQRARFHVLYSIDLAAAAIGCLLAVGLLAGGTPVEAMLNVLALLPIVAGALFALGDRLTGLAGGAMAIAAVFAVIGQSITSYNAIAKPQHLGAMGRKTLISEWNTFSVVRVHPIGFLTWTLSARYQGPKPPMLDLVIDGIGGTTIASFDGSVDTLRSYTYLEQDLPAIAHELLPADARQLIIGPGGGVDILQGVHHGRRDITAVEINPLVARVVNDDLAQFSGRPYYLPGVKFVIENGRTFIKRSRETWDLLSLSWVDTGGSPTALALSENYLYSVEAYEEFLQHLTPNGIFAFLRALGHDEVIRVDSVRGIAVAREALVGLGIADPGRHMLIAASQSPFFGNRSMCYVMVKRSPFTKDEVDKALAHIEEYDFQPMWLPDRPVDGQMREPFASFAPLIHDIMTRADRAELYRDAPLDVTPTTDDNPFYFVERGGATRPAGLGVTELRALVLILVGLVVPFLVLPLFVAYRRGHRVHARDWAALAYFSCLGAGFMLVEIEFFHVFALILGSPTITLAVVLASLLVCSGAGSFFSRRLVDAKPVWLASAFVGLVACLTFFFALKGSILSALIQLPLASRIASTAALIAPMAGFMGLPMASGMRLVRERRDIVLWGWALNGVFSVLASAAAIYLAIHVGIAATFATGAAFYVVAGLLVLVVRRSADAAPATN